MDAWVERGIASARALVVERFPDAVAAWLAGSVVSGTATAGSDLDVTVLLPGPPAPYRESLEHDGWPVELFVHTAATVDDWLGRDRARRRPTLARLVAEGVVLLDVDGAAAPVVEHCEAFLAAGPGPLADDERRSRRYGLSDQLDDLADVAEPHLRTAVAVGVWREAAELLLLEGGCWLGSGKWLVRELAAYDAARGTRFTERLDDALRRAVHGDVAALVAVAGEVLDGSGGRLWVGHRVGG